MTEPKDRVFRLLAILQLIPRHPGGISTKELHKKLEGQGFYVDLRPLQRDLTGRLSMVFHLVVADSVRPHRWSVLRDAPQCNFPALDMPTALAFLLAERHLSHLLPPGVQKLLKPHFDLARSQLQEGGSGLTRWANRVRVLPNGKALIPARIAEPVWGAVANALMQNRQLRVTYRSRAKDEEKHFCMHPAGLVSRHAISHLIATVDGHSELRQFAVHRILSAELLSEEAKVPNDFYLDRYIAQGAFSRQQNEETTTLIADISP